MLRVRVLIIIVLLVPYLTNVGAQEQTTTDLLLKALKELGNLAEQNKAIAKRLGDLENQIGAVDEKVSNNTFANYEKLKEGGET